MEISSMNSGRSSFWLLKLSFLSLAIIALGNMSASGQDDSEEMIYPTGICMDSDGNALPGAKISIYTRDSLTRTYELVSQTTTDEEGRYVFEPLPNRGVGFYEVTARAESHVSGIYSIPSPILEFPESKDFKMKKSATLKGRVVDLAGNPVSGAVVSTSMYRFSDTGIFSDVTNENGEYEIDDLNPFRRTGVPAGGELEGRPIFVAVQSPRLYVSHPDYQFKWVHYETAPGDANITIARGGAIEGRVVFAETGKPARGVEVHYQNVTGGDSVAVLTDEEGRYRHQSLRNEKYNLWINADGLTAPAIESVEVNSGETTQVADFELSRGGFVIGRLINAEDDSPIRLDEFLKESRRHSEPIVAIRGKTRPLSGAAQQVVHFEPDGTFRVRLPEGKSYVRFSPSHPWQLAENRELIEVVTTRQVKLPNGQVIEKIAVIRGDGIPVEVHEGEVTRLDLKLENSNAFQP